MDGCFELGDEGCWVSLLACLQVNGWMCSSMVVDPVLEIGCMDVRECEGTGSACWADAGGRLGRRTDGTGGGIGMVVWTWRLGGVGVERTCLKLGVWKERF